MRKASNILDWNRIGNLLKENEVFAFSNMSVSKLLEWEMSVIKNKV